MPSLGHLPNIPSISNIRFLSIGCQGMFPHLRIFHLTESYCPLHYFSLDESFFLI